MRIKVMIMLWTISIAWNVYAEPEVPGIGVMVRFQSDNLGPGWHRGFFNQLRTVPPCYLVIIFNTRTSSDEPLRISATVPINQVNRLQVSPVQGVSMQEWNELDLPDIPEQSWQEVNVGPLLPEEGQCIYEDWSDRKK